MKIKGWNDFYNGWLARVLLQEDDETQNAYWSEGWATADETWESAVLALQDEIRIGHVLVSTNENDHLERSY